MLCLEVTFRCNEPRVSQRNRLELARCSATYRRHRLPVPGLAGAELQHGRLLPPLRLSPAFFFFKIIIISWQRWASPETAQPTRSPELLSEELR